MPMKEFHFRKAVIKAEKAGGGYVYTAVYKGRTVSWASTDDTLYDDIDGNERRSHAARAYVYEKIKSVYYV